jgi:hypothetical protein
LLTSAAPIRSAVASESFLDVLALKRAVLLEHVPAEPRERDRRAERDRHERQQKSPPRVEPVLVVGHERQSHV